MSKTRETYKFKTEARQVLELMIHSVYSNKDIFLRELISNSSDALDKRRFESVKHPELSSKQEPAIHIAFDEKERVLSVADNGIGMSRDEVKNFIGTIARSGAQEFLKALRETREAGLPETALSDAVNDPIAELDGQIIDQACPESLLVSEISARLGLG